MAAAPEEERSGRSVAPRGLVAPWTSVSRAALDVQAARPTGREAQEDRLSTGQSPTEYAHEQAQAASLEGWRESGTCRAAAKACGRSRHTVMNWYDNDEAYNAAVRAAIDQYAATVGQEAHCAVREHIRRYMARETETETRRNKAGEVIGTYEREVGLDAQVIKMALARTDARFVNPPQQIEHTGKVEVESPHDLAMRLARERDERAQVGAALIEGTAEAVSSGDGE